MEAITQEQSEDSQQFTKSKEFWQGVRDVIPFMVSAIPAGIIFGTLAITSGLSFWEGSAMSGLVYSGSAQFVGLGLLNSGASWLVMILTTLMLSLRLLIYSAMLSQYIKDLPQKFRLLLGFGLIDAVFFVALDRYKKTDQSPFKAWYFMGTVIALYVNWMLATWAGILIGYAIPDLSNIGLDFAMVAVFITMIVSTLVNWKVYVSVIVAGILIMLTYSIPYNLGVIVSAFGGAIAAVLCEKFEVQSAARKEKGVDVR